MFSDLGYNRQLFKLSVLGLLLIQLVGHLVHGAAVEQVPFMSRTLSGEDPCRSLNITTCHANLLTLNCAWLDRTGCRQLSTSAAVDDCQSLGGLLPGCHIPDIVRQDRVFYISNRLGSPRNSQNINVYSAWSMARKLLLDHWPIDGTCREFDGDSDDYKYLNMFDVEFKGGHSAFHPYQYCLENGTCCDTQRVDLKRCTPIPGNQGNSSEFVGIGLSRKYMGIMYSLPSEAMCQSDTIRECTWRNPNRRVSSLSLECLCKKQLWGMTYDQVAHFIHNDRGCL